MAKVICAAGGLVWWDSPAGPLVAVIHRPHHRDWSLPKGKLKRGESWERAAVREVHEEVGCKVRLGEFAGSTSYLVRGGPKVVLYWNMQCAGETAFEPTEEVDQVTWLPPRQAIARLSYDSEKKLVAEVWAARRPSS